MPAAELGTRPVVLLLGPIPGAVSGISTHLDILLRSGLAADFELLHFAVGSEGRSGHRGWRIATSPLRLAANLLRRRPALLHLNSSLNPRAFWRDVLYLSVATLLGVRVLYQVHGGALPQDFLGNQPLARALLRRILALPTAVVVLADAELSAYRRFLPDQRVVQIPNAIDCAPLLSLRREPRGTGSPLRLIYLGRLAREKGLYELLQGLADARRAGTDAHLTLVGTGPEEAPLRQRAAELQLGAAALFTGAAFGAEKLERLGRADVLVLPSYTEGLPCALLEGMAAGNAVIATYVGGIPDVASEAVHGRLVPPRDAAAIAAAITELAADPACLARMSAACRTRIATHHSMERLARDFGALYARLLAAKPTGHEARCAE